MVVHTIPCLCEPGKCRRHTYSYKCRFESRWHLVPPQYFYHICIIIIGQSKLAHTARAHPSFHSKVTRRIQFLLPWMGCSCPTPDLPVPIYTPVPKNTTRWPQPELELRPLDPEVFQCTNYCIWPSHLPCILWCKKNNSKLFSSRLTSAPSLWKFLTTCTVSKCVVDWLFSMNHGHNYLRVLETSIKLMKYSTWEFTGMLNQWTDLGNNTSRNTFTFYAMFHKLVFYLVWNHVKPPPQGGIPYKSDGEDCCTF